MRIGVDVDDVVADLHTAWLARYNKAHDTMWTPDDMTQWDFENDLGCTSEELAKFLTPDIYRVVKPIPGAYATVEALRDMGHEIHFVTSCRDEAMFYAKYDWLDRHGFLIASSCVWPVGSWTKHKTKATVPVDLLVDDSIENVTAFPKAAYLVTRPHNRTHLCTRKRVKELMDVPSLVRHMPVVPVPVPAVPDADTVHAIESKVGKGSLPSDWQARKDTPIMRGMLDYFPNAAAEIARISAAGNKQHFTPGTPLHWDYAKSSDHADSCVRHLMDRGTFDTDGTRHMAKAAWRAMAALETELIEAGATPGRAVKMPEVCNVTGY